MTQLTFDDIETQLCARCQRHLPLEAYHPKKRGRVGHYCRECCNDYKRDQGPHRTCNHPGCDIVLSGRYRYYCADHRVSQRPARGPSRRAVGYVSAHLRVAYRRGRASTHPCAHNCGRPAEHWAYDHADPDEIHGSNAQGSICAYSLDPAHYMPLCRPCHTAFDSPRRGRRKSTPIDEYIERYPS